MFAETITVDNSIIWVLAFVVLIFALVFFARRI